MCKQLPVVGKDSLNLNDVSPDTLQQVKILAGGQQYAGRLCLWSPDNTDSDASKYDTFIEYRRTLRLKCANASSPATFQWTPTVDTPDTVYFQVLLSN
jgi:hypothetical protein